MLPDSTAEKIGLWFSVNVAVAAGLTLIKKNFLLRMKFPVKFTPMTFTVPRLSGVPVNPVKDWMGWAPTEEKPVRVASHVLA